MTLHCRPLHINRKAREWNASASTSTDLIEGFHRHLPNYSRTPLVQLEDLARELDVRAIYLKDESRRFGLPSFQILGASWGTYRAILQRCGFGLETSIEAVKAAVRTRRLVLYAATDGNHGRAVAHMGGLFGIEVKIYVPENIDRATVKLIRDEGAEVVRLNASYDEVVSKAHEDATRNDGVLVQDTAFEGYEEIPQWIVEGYSTLMREINIQLEGISPDWVLVPVGVGSLAQSVTLHSKVVGRSTSVLTVEPNDSACLWQSLSRGRPCSLQTSRTIMAGMDCGTVSTIAWPVLSAGVDASITVSDYEAHAATQYLSSKGIMAGPCGAAPIAALRRLTEADKQTLNLHRASVIVLLCTEGAREYEAPAGVNGG